MSKVKTSDLTGKTLDWAVAQCENRKDKYWMNHSVWGTYSPSTMWDLGGRIIEREKIGLIPHGFVFKATNMENTIISLGNTPLEAAMKSYVASKFGLEIEIPEELL